MKMEKRLVCGLLSLVLVLCLAACGQDKPTGDMVGTWQRDEAVFLAYYKAKVDLSLKLKDDGTYEKTITNHETNEVLAREEGSWTFDGAQLSCVKQQETAATNYEYDPDSNTLENAGYEYKKIS